VGEIIPEWWATSSGISNKETDYPEEMARKLLIEFIGDAGEGLRDQFA
jgi:hypothetical protein